MQYEPAAVDDNFVQSRLGCVTGDRVKSEETKKNSFFYFYHLMQLLLLNTRQKLGIILYETFAGHLTRKNLNKIWQLNCFQTIQTLGFISTSHHINTHTHLGTNLSLHLVLCGIQSIKKVEQLCEIIFLCVIRPPPPPECNNVFAKNAIFKAKK